MIYDTIEEAARAWVETFDAVPMSVVRKLLTVNEDDLYEITPPAPGDRVYLTDGFHESDTGEVVRHDPDDTEAYIVRLDDTDDKEVSVKAYDLDVMRDDGLPMWGTMWAFHENLDNDWLSGKYGENGLQLMADCGFRVYESEDYGYLFGIDGAGYDFYEQHWCPLYKARGLHWHKDA